MKSIAEAFCKINLYFLVFLALFNANVRLMIYIKKNYGQVVSNDALPAFEGEGQCPGAATGVGLRESAPPHLSAPPQKSIAPHLQRSDTIRRSLLVVFIG